MRARFSASLLVTLFILLALAGASFVVGQSGRQKDTTKPKPKSRPGPIAEPVKSPPVRSTQSPSSEKSNDEVAEDEIVRITSNLIPIPASVVDEKGMALTGLRLEDFELRIDGQLKPISDLSRTETSVRLAMLFDNSGSLDFAREFEKRAAMHFFRRVMRPIDEAAIFSVESESYLAQSFTRDIARLEYVIHTFGKPEGSTSLFDAVVDAAAYLRPYSGRRIIVIVSDGIDTTSRNDFASTVAQVLVDDCQVFIVQTGLYDGANLRALAAERRMEQLSGQTGGAVYIPKNPDQLDLAFQQIAADLAQQYVLSYYSVEEPRDGRFHAIDLRVKSRKDVRVRARKGYYSLKRSNVALSRIGKEAPRW